MLNVKMMLIRSSNVRQRKLKELERDGATLPSCTNVMMQIDVTQKNMYKDRLDSELT